MVETTLIVLFVLVFVLPLLISIVNVGSARCGPTFVSYGTTKLKPWKSCRFKNR